MLKLFTNERVTINMEAGKDLARHVRLMRGLGVLFKMSLFFSCLEIKQISNSQVYNLGQYLVTYLLAFQSSLDHLRKL